MDAILKLNGITKQFGGVVALGDVSFDLKDGEIMGVIGPNGAGKTTLVNIINGVYAPTSGDVWFSGRRITGLKTYQIARLGLARTFQVVKPLMGMTVQESVMTAALFGNLQIKKSMEGAKRITNEMLDLVGLSGKKNYLSTQLTIADLKRLELAKALSMQPRLLLLDEAMAGLNPVEIEGLMSLAQTINRLGVTMLVIEHVMKAIMGISHRVVVLHNGRKLSEGDPHSVAQDPGVINAYLGKRYGKVVGE